MNNKAYILLLLLIVGINTTTCEHGTLEDGTTCYTESKVKNCKIKNPNHDSCYQCNDDSFFDSSDPKICIKRITNCKSQTSADSCSQCEDGYKWDSTDKVCTACSGNYYTTNICLSDHCLDGTAADVCTKCEEGFKLVSDSCSPCEENKINPTGQGNSCTVDKIPGCVKHDSGGTNCLKCEQGKFIKDSNTCVACTETGEHQQGDHCFAKTQEEVTTCNSKSGLFKISDGNCIDKIPNCEEYDTTTGKCKTCKNILGTDSDGSNCIPCHYPEVVFNGECHDYGVKYCKTYSSSTVCSSCEDGYELKDEICVPKCKDCDDDKKGEVDGSNANSLKINTIFMAFMILIFA